MLINSLLKYHRELLYYYRLLSSFDPFPTLYHSITRPSQCCFKLYIFLQYSNKLSYIEDQFVECNCRFPLLFRNSSCLYSSEPNYWDNPNISDLTLRLIHSILMIHQIFSIFLGYYPCCTTPFCGKVSS